MEEAPAHGPQSMAEFACSPDCRQGIWGGAWCCGSHAIGYRHPCRLRRYGGNVGKPSPSSVLEASVQALRAALAQVFRQRANGSGLISGAGAWGDGKAWLVQTAWGQRDGLSATRRPGGGPPAVHQPPGAQPGGRGGGPAGGAPGRRHGAVHVCCAWLLAPARKQCNDRRKTGAIGSTVTASSSSSNSSSTRHVVTTSNSL